MTIRTLAVVRAPGYPYLNDKLTAGQTGAWSEIISGWMVEEIDAGKGDQNGNTIPLDGPDRKGCDGKPRTNLTHFFNGRVTPYDVGQKPASITWIGFPNLDQQKFPADLRRWEGADTHRDVQDEYLEWNVKRAQNGDVVSVTFNYEGPEYWKFLVDTAPDKALVLYQSCNPEFASEMKKDDLFDDKGEYEPYNKWKGVLKVKSGDDEHLITVNPGCIMHLAQRNNTLGAEIDIAAQGTVIRKREDGTIIVGEVELCKCSAYGNPTRNSDPKIGSTINALARNGAKISIAYPVAIYMREFTTSQFMLDADGTGSDLQPVPAGTFTWVRGDIKKHMGLRLHIQVPDGILGTGGKEGQQLTVKVLMDTSNGQNIMYGAQFADYMTMSVNGVVISGGTPAPAEECPCKCVPQSNGESDSVSANVASSKSFERLLQRIRI